jgi:uncharacterized protein (TIGR02996 family)
VVQDPDFSAEGDGSDVRTAEAIHALWGPPGEPDGPRPRAGQDPNRNPELEALIVADPDNQASYLVYGDWLLARGDIRGQLISLQIAAAREPRDVFEIKNRSAEVTRAFIEDNYPELTETMFRRTLVWKWGFVASVLFAMLESSSRHARMLDRLMADGVALLLRRPRRPAR